MTAPSLAAAIREAEESLRRHDTAHWSERGSEDNVYPCITALRALLAAWPEAKTPVTTPVPWLECLTVISNPIVPQGAILIHPDTLAGKPDALAYRPPDPLPPPGPPAPRCARHSQKSSSGAPAKGPLGERCDFCGAPRLHRCVEKRWRTSPDGLRYVETTGRDKPHAARVHATRLRQEEGR